MFWIYEELPFLKKKNSSSDKSTPENLSKVSLLSMTKVLSKLMEILKQMFMDIILNLS